MAGVFESKFAPSACEFWQANRIPHSPLYPRTQFLRWFDTDSEENYRKRGNQAFSVESVGYEFNSLGYRGPEFNREPGEAVVMFLGDSYTFGVGMPWEKLWTSLLTKHLELICAAKTKDRFALKILTPAHAVQLRRTACSRARVRYSGAQPVRCPIPLPRYARPKET